MWRQCGEPLPGLPTLVVMRYLRYTHALVKPFIAVWLEFLHELIRSRLVSSLGRLIPGPAGRRIIGRLSLALALIAQIVSLWLLSELITIAVDVMHLWALLAHKHLEITL